MAREPQIVLGIDPGYGRMGFGVIKSIGREVQALDFGCLDTPTGTDFGRRLHLIHLAVKKICDKYKPDVAVIEELFFTNNAKTAIKVGEARGVIYLTLLLCGVKILEYTPLEIKQAVTGDGRADKVQIEKMVRMLIGEKKRITPDDAADALAGALTGVYCSRR
ncbi:MAG TPA: crossover junction endodeoxyribonuclease RuvC [Candidatus Magasanikbacteria bacterium]|nr:crossover junction endodeoxyribonuclease RuvC [Candidatus Magasanikbacteria bacterium]